MTETIESRPVVTWEGPGEPIVLALYGSDGEAAAVPLLEGALKQKFAFKKEIW